MKASYTVLFIIVYLLFVNFFGWAQTIEENKITRLPGHPRILLLAGEEQAIRKTIEADQTWAKLHKVILDECDKIIDMPPLQRIQIGRRLLDKSRECLRRVFFLSYAYRISLEKNI